MTDERDSPTTAEPASIEAPTGTPPRPNQGIDAYSVPGQVLDPQRLLRIAGVAREALEEARRIRPEPGAVDHLRRLHGQISSELKEALPTELYDELDDLTPDIRDGSLEELSLAHAEILGWLEGLFQGTQLALQVRAAQALEHVRRPLPREGPRPEAEERSDSRYL
ncbi:MAG TPA: proteasome activator [Actinomycetota bacterium]|nr:proteasome activator [Actinomycetota bacterium]